MSCDIPEWVRMDCRAWGHQKRRIWSGCDWHGNVDGYAQSLLGRIRDEREGAGEQGARSQFWPEVYRGGGLDVQRCLFGMPERQVHVLHFQYVWDPQWGITAARKADYLAVKRTEYFELVDRCETWVHSRLELQAQRSDAQLVERVHEIVREALQKPEREDTKAHRGESLPAKGSKLDFAPLNRSAASLTR